jgi:hypothetical protein
MCRGTERFRVANLNRREAEYLVAEIEVYPDEPSQAPAMAMVSQRVSALFDEYYRMAVALTGGWQRPVRNGERTLLLDMAALAASQARLHEEEAKPEEPRTIRVPVLPDDPEALSNIVGSELNMSAQLKQELLELPSALARLQREAELLSDETPELEERLKQQFRRRFSAFGMSS